MAVAISVRFPLVGSATVFVMVSFGEITGSFSPGRRFLGAGSL